MSFNLDVDKQAQEVIFSRILQKSNHPSLTFNGTSVTQSEIQKLLGMFLDSKLDFNPIPPRVFRVSSGLGGVQSAQHP